MNTVIRKVFQKEYRITENITREAFWNVYKPGCNEHLVLCNLRKSPNYINDLDLVAIYENEIVGHIISTKAKVIDSFNNEREILCVGPLSVLPSFQKKGIGAQLLNKSIILARKLNFKGMILFGNPDYYHRFGFKNAKEFEISTRDNQNFEPFMAIELYEHSLSDVKGKFIEDDGFIVNDSELIEFEKQFPHKEKLITDSQLEH